MSQGVGVNRITRQLSDEDKRKIVETHERMVHRGIKVVLEKLQEEGQGDYMEEEIRDVLKPCILCKMYNPIRSRPYRKIEAFGIGEKVGMDIMEPQRGQYIATAIDYFSRKGYAAVLPNKGSSAILSFLKKVGEDIKIQTLITDGGRKHGERD